MSTKLSEKEIRDLIEKSKNEVSNSSEKLDKSLLLPYMDSSTIESEIHQPLRRFGQGRVKVLKIKESLIKVCIGSGWLNANKNLIIQKYGKSTFEAFK
jgi:hypothetical protein